MLNGLHQIPFGAVDELSFCVIASSSNLANTVNQKTVEKRSFDAWFGRILNNETIIEIIRLMG